MNRRLLYVLAGVSILYLFLNRGLIMKTAAEIVKKFEGFSLKPYKDSAGKLTVGWGHLLKVTEPVQPITLEHAQQLLIEDMREATNAINNYVTVPITDSQRNALISLTFNIGVTAFKNSTLLKKLNEGDYTTAANQFLVCNKETKNGLKENLINQ